MLALLPGLYLLQNQLNAETQRLLWTECRALADGPVPMYTPTVRGGRPMSVGMLCLGRHWNAQPTTTSLDARTTTVCRRPRFLRDSRPSR